MAYSFCLFSNNWTTLIHNLPSIQINKQLETSLLMASWFFQYEFSPDLYRKVLSFSCIHNSLLQRGTKYLELLVWLHRSQWERTLNQLGISQFFVLLWCKITDLFWFLNSCFPSYEEPYLIFWDNVTPSTDSRLVEICLWIQKLFTLWSLHFSTHTLFFKHLELLKVPVTTWR